MITLWIWLILLTFTIYVLLDGFDIGVGLLHLGVARDGAERRATIKAIAPIWDGNEVWLIAGGGTLFAAFPALFSAAFSGFYLPLMIFLWLLALRALGIELQHQLADPMWLRFWDYVFAASSWLIALVLGAAIGGIVRGLPLSADGTFFLPLWTDFMPSGQVGVFDLYTLLTALATVAVLALHGAAWLNLRLSGDLQSKVKRILPRLWLAALILIIATTWATFQVQPRALSNLRAHFGFVVFPCASALALVVLRISFSGQPQRCFAASCLLLVGLAGSAASAIWPYGLPSSLTDGGLRFVDSATDESALGTMLYWWLPGMALVIGYTYFVYSRLPKRHEG